MQIDPAALSRTDTISTPVITSKSISTTTSSSQKAPKTSNTAQRIDLEPIYADLKSAIGDNWGGYKEAISEYLKGSYNQNELRCSIDQYICADPRIEHLHNQLICAILGNLNRDLPDHGVAGWVSLNDKPTVVSKPVSGDAAEQRLKTEVMQLPPRDRRRLKAIPEIDVNDLNHNPLEEYQLAKQIKAPDLVPASAGGLNKTNWDLEIRKRYSKPLASEIGEFPDTDTIFARMVPICYEESIHSGCQAPCPEFMAMATETFVKEFLSKVFGRTRSNGPVGTHNGIMTRKYRKQLDKEEAALLRGELKRDATNGILPVEAKEANARRPLGIGDLRLATEVGGGLLGQMPLIIDRVMGSHLEGELELQNEDLERDRAAVAENDNTVHNGEEMDVDENDWGWEGGRTADHDQLSQLLDDCLTMAS